MCLLAISSGSRVEHGDKGGTLPIVLPLQRETRGVLSSVHWVYRTAISPSQPTIITLQPIALGATSEAMVLRHG